MPHPINFRALFSLFRPSLCHAFFIISRHARSTRFSIRPILCVRTAVFGFMCMCVWIRKYIRTLLQIIFDGPIIYRIIYSLDLLCCYGNFIHTLHRNVWSALKLLNVCVSRGLFYRHGVSFAFIEIHLQTEHMRAYGSRFAFHSTSFYLLSFQIYTNLFNNNEKWFAIGSLVLPRNINDSIVSILNINEHP